MQVVSAREFRSNQGKEEEEDLTQRIIRGLKEVKMIQEGKSKGYTLKELLDEL